jgi:tetratricopeptide (TPR) repeat protein/tRNA A-37 threonylcarbamoyl transferase component Bud32
MMSRRRGLVARDAGRLSTDDDLAALWQCWCTGDDSVQPHLIARGGELPPEHLVQLLVVEQPQRWRAGDHVHAEDFFRQFPSLKAQRDCALDLIYAEFVLEADAGGAPEPSDYLARFPEFREELRRQFELERGWGVQDSRNGTATWEDRKAVSQNETEAIPARSSGAAPRPACFGDYEVLDVIAEGGMGVVYKARQRSLNRIVALKMIKSGRFADAANVERFCTEAKAAANLQHSHIVAVHEIGQHGGQHFFSMDFIEGNTLAQMVRDHALRPDDAARYTKAVAETMQFAHEHGVLHRDLKPANIIVDTADEPRITDFGLAKQLESTSHLTMDGFVMGTPSYMPPEQAAGRIQELGPSSDVYSIGAICYELLTGRPPFRAASPFDTIKQVLDVEAVSPRLLNPGVPRDLETICLKCLQKEKTRRYASAQDLADELGRFLADEPIQSRPVGRLERTWRWCRRNPHLAGAVATAVICLFAALVALAAANLWTQAALDTAERRLHQTRQAIDELFTLVAEETLLNEPGLQPLRKQLLLKARDLYKDVLAEETNDPRVRHDLSISYFLLGRIMDEVGSPKEALEPYHTAWRMQRELVAEQPGDERLQYDQANTANAMGTVYSVLRQYDQARPWLQQARDIRQSLVDEYPGRHEYQRKLANTLMNLGLIDQELGDLKQATRRIEAAQQLRTELLRRGFESEAVRRDLARGYYEGAMLAAAQCDLAWNNQDGAALERHLAQATDGFQSAIEHLEQLLAANPQSLAVQYDLVNCYRHLADMTLEPAAAEAQYQKAHRRLQTLAEENPDVHEYRARLAGIEIQIADLCAEHDLDRSLNGYQQACDRLIPLVDQYPNIPDYRADLGKALLEIGRCQFARGKLADAADSLCTSSQHFRRLLDRSTDASTFARRLAESLELVAQVAESYFERGDSAKALNCIERAIQLDPDNASWHELRERFAGDPAKP